MQVDLKETWNSVLQEIEPHVSPAGFSTWLKNTNIVDYRDKTVYIGVQNTFARDWIEEKCCKVIIRILRSVIPDFRSIEYMIISRDDKKQKNADVLEINDSSSGQLGFQEFYVDNETNLNPRYLFDNFVVGSFNEVAYAAALGVLENVGTLYNPLFVYGGVGLGKTHLLQAIGNKLKLDHPNAKVHYITSEKFAGEYVNSIQNKDAYLFKEKYRKYNLLIIDDIQFFAGKLKIQEEFFHVFNSLYDKNSQIIFSSDKPPAHIDGLEDRLRSRFEGGMIIDITQPEYESRLAILRNKSEQKSFPISNELLEFIANTIRDNIRELEGALNSVIGQSRIKGRVLDVNEVGEILKKNARPYKSISIPQVIKIIADYYSVDENSLFAKTRKKEIVRPRQIAMYIMREELRSSFPLIGQKFGQRDHTTVIYACRKITNELKKNKRLNDEIEHIKLQLRELRV